mgnify:CR=1 FL=1
MQTTLWTPKAEKAEFWNTSFFPLRGGTHLSASLPGSLVASDALGSARSGFEATPVVDADHGKSESHRRRLQGCWFNVVRRC